jgi:lysophospholipase L1-like esterase
MKRGVVALGDSITRGRGGSPTLGVHPQSWALWLAEALGLPVTVLGVDGAIAGDLVRDQLPRLQPPYDLATLFVGANDARSIGFDPERFDADVATLVHAVADAADRLVVLTVPLDLGRPPAGAKVGDANELIRRAAADAGALVVALDDLRGRRFLLPDAVHPHAVGQLEIADRAARVLGAPRLPSALADRDRGLRAEARWALAWGRMWVRDVNRRRRERL